MMERIAKIIAKELCISIEYLKSDSRLSTVLKARQFFYKAARNQKYTLYEIADFIDKDHSTVVHALKKFDEYYDTDKLFRERFNKVANKTRSRTSVEIAQDILKDLQKAGLSSYEMITVLQLSKKILIANNK